MHPNVFQNFLLFNENDKIFQILFKKSILGQNFCFNVLDLCGKNMTLWLSKIK